MITPEVPQPRVLVVEDDVSLRYLTARVFEIWGWKASRAATAAEALAFLAAPGVAYDLVMLDLMLGPAAVAEATSSGGLAVLKEIKAMAAPPHVIVVTASDLQSKASSEAIAFKPDLFFVKPWPSDQVEDYSASLATEFLSRHNIKPR